MKEEYLYAILETLYQAVVYTKQSGVSKVLSKEQSGEDLSMAEMMDNIFTYPVAESPSLIDIIVKEIYAMKKITIDGSYIMKVLDLWEKKQYPVDGSLMVTVMVADHIDQLAKSPKQ